MIVSVGNERIKRIASYNSKSSNRNKDGVYLVEGHKMFCEAPINDILEIYVTQSYIDRYGYDDRIDINKYVCVSEAVFSKISDTRTPQGVLVVMRQPILFLDIGSECKCYSKEDNNSRTGRALRLIIDGVQDPGNLGTIFRSSEATGVEEIIMSSNTVDIYNPKTIRATMGSIYRVAHRNVDNIVDYIREVKLCGYKIIVTSLQSSIDYRNIECSDKIALIVGNEANGVSDELVNLADECVRIPMRGKVESLNVAIATSVLLYALCDN